MSRDIRMRPRPREHRPKPRTWPPLTPAQQRFFRQLLDELDTGGERSMNTFVYWFSWFGITWSILCFAAVIHYSRKTKRTLARMERR